MSAAGHTGLAWTAYDAEHKLTLGVGYLTAPSAEGFQSLTNKGPSATGSDISDEFDRLLDSFRAK